MKKIMFNDKYGLTQAVLEGRKTQTRRIINIDENRIYDFQYYYYNMTLDSLNGIDLISAFFNEYPNMVKYKIGEIVAVAQKYADCGGLMEDGTPRWNFIARIAGKKNRGWSNKMFINPELMPHQIIITNVRIEHLQDISDEDCLAEGVELNTRQYQYDGTKYYCVRGLGHWRSIGCNNYNSPREAYAVLIDKVNGKGTWKRNPYVFVYDFKLLK